MKLEEVPLSKAGISCANCKTRNFCLSQNFNEYEIDRVNSIVQTRRTIKKGTKLIKTGMTFQSIYAIRTGYFKTSFKTESGETQLLGFQMTGDSLGMDGIATHKQAGFVSLDSLSYRGSRRGSRKCADSQNTSNKGSYDSFHF